MNITDLISKAMQMGLVELRNDKENWGPYWNCINVNHNFRIGNRMVRILNANPNFELYEGANVSIVNIINHSTVM